MEKASAEKTPVRKIQSKETPGGKASAEKTPVRKIQSKKTPGMKVTAENAPGRKGLCPAAAKCGGCDLQGIEYSVQLEQKNRKMKKLLHGLVEVYHPIIGMDDPSNYRCKVNAAFGVNRKGVPVLGKYEKNSHHIVQAGTCMIEDEKANAIANEIYQMLRSFRIRVYDEDTGYGFLRHVQIRKGYATNQYMVTLVCTDPVFPSKQNFVKALRKEFPEISTVVLNINDRQTSMVLGERNITLYGKGYIEDRLCSCTFRISPGSFYQVNPEQTEKLYRTAMQYAALTGKETVFDTYCGTGTIGIIAAGSAGRVIGVELNPDAVSDAVWNARRNNVRNIQFIKQDATDYMESLSLGGAKGEKNSPDVIILDPPRQGTTQRFIEAAATLSPERIIYISCGPEALARDLKLFRKNGYTAKEAQCVDLFPYTNHVETVVLMTKHKLYSGEFEYLWNNAEKYNPENE